MVSLPPQHHKPLLSVSACLSSVDAKLQMHCVSLLERCGKGASRPGSNETHPVSQKRAGPSKADGQRSEAGRKRQEQGELGCGNGEASAARRGQGAGGGVELGHLRLAGLLNTGFSPARHAVMVEGRPVQVSCGCGVRTWHDLDAIVCAFDRADLSLIG
jgi:hypothetical protein